MEYFYQIKGKRIESDEDDTFSIYGNSSNWSWPPIYSGLVMSESRKEAKKLIEQEYSKQFPMRVLSKDLDSNNFLLRIQELNDRDSFIRGFFEYKKCEQCENTFRIIDKYNIGSRGGSHSYCSEKCNSIAREEWREKNSNNFYEDKYPSKIYKITNKITDQCYIGQTTQAFTLRWYQHFFQSGDNKFHTAIRESKISDWTFEIIEELKTNDKKYLTEREQYWIDKYDSVDNGYNSVIAMSDEKVMDNKQLNLGVSEVEGK